MAVLPRPVTMMMLVPLACLPSYTQYWMSGLSTSGSISLGCALVAGRKRVPNPAAGKTALRIGTVRFMGADYRPTGSRAGAVACGARIGAGSRPQLVPQMTQARVEAG